MFLIVINWNWMFWKLKKYQNHLFYESFRFTNTRLRLMTREYIFMALLINMTLLAGRLKLLHFHKKQRNFLKLR